MKNLIQFVIILVTWQVLRLGGTPSGVGASDPYRGSNSAIYTVACVADQIDIHAARFVTLLDAQAFIDGAPALVGISNLSIKQIP